MGNGAEKERKSSAELQEEIAKRKAWFFECQLRRLNLECFRDVEVNEKLPDVLLDLISEPLFTMGFPGGQVGAKMKKIGQVYLDSQQPVWTGEEREQRNEYKHFIGLEVNWLDYNIPTRLKENLEKLKTTYESTRFSSVIDANDEWNRYGREDPSVNKPDPVKDPPKDQNRISHAISRVEVTQRKPWLIPEVFNVPNTDTFDVEKWIKNGETFISNYEQELNEILGGNRKPEKAFTPGDANAYRLWVKALLKDAVEAKSSAVKVEFLDRSGDVWKFAIKINTPAYPLNTLTDYPFSDSGKYWINTCINALEEIYVIKPDSDMGLCMLMRTLYLYGTLPSKLNNGNALRWRNRLSPTPDFHLFFGFRAKLVKKNLELQERLLLLQTKLQILLEETAARPHSGAIYFSPLAQEIIKQDILRYKFWMDEPFNAYANAGNPGNEEMLSHFNRARKDILVPRKAAGRDGPEPFVEMEYWSENHYIMFASSEYLAGQLWEEETFQPGMDFLTPNLYMTATATEFVPVLFADKSTELTGKQRMERGKARTLKWLNNRLMFGWTEFNSSGYYREHLTALLNLVDFSLDEEVRVKAGIVTDLLFFDLVRFSHKGSMGAAGGRSQFKSKCAGWDNALGDVVELLLGTRGIFLNREGDIGCCLSTSTYKIPDVLLQIANYPPSYSFTDRSRVSVTFEEASKYNIQYSQKSDQKEAIEKGFRAKRAKHYGFLKKINDDITRTHYNYTAKEDDTVFWWTMSGFFNKQVVKNTLECIEKFGLKKCEVFEKLLKLIEVILPLTEKTSNGLLGAAIGSVTGAGAAVIAGTALGFFSDDITGSSMIEKGSDDLSFFLEGSTRTRANILTYRNPDVMLSSLQNFRTGQFNFQTNVNQATLNTSVNVFTTAAFAGIDLSSLETGFLGGVLGGAVSGGFAGALLGAYASIAANELLIGKGEIATHGDGPGWWTGYWALPMVVQHESAAIIAYDFNTLQKHVADAGSHVWFPKKGFEKTEERRTSAYDDENFALLDIGDIGPKGFWLFGKIVHKKNALNPDANEEAYVGVFSNQRPEWLTQDSDFYSERITELKFKALDPFNNDPNAVHRVLKDFSDFFAEKDWYVSGKNIWIIQVGNRNEFGNFDNFKDRVRKAKVSLDDAGDMECSYAIPKEDGSSQTLSLKYGDGGEFKLDGNPFETDLYPRFKNPFIRGGRVEWGQREYIIEHNGSSLLHYFTDFQNPLRLEDIKSTPDDLNTISGLVIYINTGDEEMERWSVAQATVQVGCQTVALDEVVAAGEVSENTYHDAEWIFFESMAALSPDMTIEIKHPRISKTGDDPEWKASFTLKALRGDRSLRDCALSFSYHHFQDDNRSSGLFPFTVSVGLWQRWAVAEENRPFKTWLIAPQSGYENYYYNYCDLLGFDENNQLWHRRLQTCPGEDAAWLPLSSTGSAPDFAATYSFRALSTQPRNLFLFAINNGALYIRWRQPGTGWAQQSWTTTSLEAISQTTFGLPDLNAPHIPIILFPLSQIAVQRSTVLPGGVDICISGADSNFYMRYGWLPGFNSPWQLIKTTALFVPLWNASFEVVNDILFAVDVQHRLWGTSISESAFTDWQMLSPDWLRIKRFSIAHKEDFREIIVTTAQSEVWAAGFVSLNDSVVWERVGKGINFLVAPESAVSWAIRDTGHLNLFAPGADGRVYTTWRTEQQGWEDGPTWTPIRVEEDLSLENKATGTVAVLTRVRGQIEIYAERADKKIWKSWWS
jgi:hypothetical protein